ncbi:antibiotic biosynthesis monooxygenase [Nonomuraea sp. MCN248]|uniref:Antibiotic biosynthesis monooxygenase n=1 Tax=Nonomuraea corallina TaxID=2989783 RepID=A0ABT4SCY6_9ACTN|nr:antibiotic biosynthesis monooxygenase [Nonomuraea corallina]MDA0634830.1 antibiotic biosynthesis monooxygenase [Nonomuraea corallina]
MSVENMNNAVIAITRFKAKPEDAEEVKAKHATLASTVRAAVPGLEEARLGRAEDGVWIGVWRWDSQESLRKAQELAHSLPEATAAFALASDVTAETAELVQES